MKRYIRSNHSGKQDIQPIEFEICVDIIPKYTTQEVMAAMYKGYNIPDGEVISGLRSAIITDKIEIDYEAFIESLEDLLTEYYGLELFYKNRSDDYSHYYSFLAKDKDSGKIYFKLRLRLRISNHDPHRSDASQKHKKEETETERYKELTKDAAKDPKPYTKVITVNKEQFSNYEEAFIALDNEIAKWVEIMKR